MTSIYNFLLNILELNYKKKLIKVLKNNLGKNIKIFFDVGAHHGETTILFSKHFNIKKSYLFEPIIYNFRILTKNLNNSKLSDRCIKNNFALGEKDLKSKIQTVLETSSSTLNEIDENTKYFKRKKKILSFFNKNAKITNHDIYVKSTLNYIRENNILKIDLLKIDTEGYEYFVLRNLKQYLKNIKLILFEHHYDLMIKKNYKFQDINKILISNNFHQIYKSKMIFRKSFEYAYLNKNFYEKK